MQAIPFIKYFPDRGFEISSESESLLKSIDDPLAVICVVGKYRTGKSFLLNRILLQDKQAFGVGNTINPCTKGLWMYSQPVDLYGQSTKCIIIDCEGFGGLDENCNHDNKIFLLALLISSYFIYNSQGNIDENNLSGLMLIIHLCKELINKQSQNNVQFPMLLWVVRDFVLKLEDTQGNQISEKEYMERALQELKGNNEQIRQKNKTRRLIKQFFSDRDCITMVRPLQDEDQLQRLNQIDDCELRPQFREKADLLRQKVFTSVKAKRVSNQQVNGRMLLSLCQNYVDVINSGGIPNIQNSFYYVSQQQNTQNVKEIIISIDEQLNQFKDNELDMNKIEQIETDLLRKSVSKFKKNAIGDSEIYVKKIKEELDKKVKQFKQSVMKKWEDQLNQEQSMFLDQIYSKLDCYKYHNQNDLEQDLQNYQNNIIKMSDKVNIKIEKQIEREISKIRTIFDNQIQKKKEQENQQQIKNIEQTLQQLQLGLDQKKEESENEKIIIKEQQREIEDKYESELRSVQKQNDKLQKQIGKIRNDLLQEKEKCNQKDLENQQKDKRLVEVRQECQDYKYKVQKIQNELDKQQALNTQMMMFKEKECNQYEKQIDIIQKDKQEYQNCIEQYKQRIQNLDYELSELKIFNNDINNQIKQKEQWIQEIEQKLQQKQQEKNEQKSIQNQTKHQRQTSDWIVERTYLQNQVKLLQVQIDENQKTNKELVNAIQKGFNNEKKEENHQKCQEIINQYRQQLQQNDGMIIKYEKYKKIIKSCISMQCRQCKNIIHSKQIEQHINQCQLNLLNLKQETKVNTEQRMEVSISATILKENKQGMTYSEYILEIRNNGNKYQLNRKYRQFCELFQELKQNYPGLQMQQIDNLIFYNDQLKSEMNQKMKVLQNFLRSVIKTTYLLKNASVRRFFQLDDISQDIVMGNIQKYQLDQIEKQQMKEKEMIQLSPEQFITEWTNNKINDRENTFYGLKSKNKDNTVISQIQQSQIQHNHYELSDEQSLLGLINKENQDNGYNRYSFKDRFKYNLSSQFNPQKVQSYKNKSGIQNHSRQKTPLRYNSQTRSKNHSNSQSNHKQQLFN